MKKYKIIYGDGTEEDMLFDSYAAADDYALYVKGSYSLGGEILELSNPGDYPYDEDDEMSYEIVEVDV